MKSILIFVIILITCFLIYRYNSAEHFNIADAPQGNISNIQFAHMFDQVVLPSADELSEMGGRYQALEGIESPKMDLHVPQNNANTWIGVD